MSLIDSYDESEEVVRADILTKGQKRLPKTAIVCFKKGFFVNSWGAIFINQLDSKISLSLNHFT